MNQRISKSLRREARELTSDISQYTRRLYRAAKRAYRETPWNKRKGFTIKKHESKKKTKKNS